MRRVFAPVFVAGLGLGLFGCADGPTTPESVIQASEQTIDNYDCDVTTPNISVGDVSAESLAQFGDSSIGQAYTTDKGIKLDDDLSTEMMVQDVIHETVHWCTDQDDSRTYDTPIDLPGIGALTGAEGFAPKFNGNYQIDNNIAEEGVTEWLALENDRYDGYLNYSSLATLTGIIAVHSDITVEEMLSLHNDDDIVGFVAAAKDKPVEDVTGTDINDIFYMYADASDLSSEEIDPQQINQILEQ